MALSRRVAAASQVAANAIVRTAAFAILFLVAAFAFAIVTTLPAVILNGIAYGIADLFWNPRISGELTQGLIAFAFGVLFAAYWAVRLSRLRAEYPSVAAYIIIAAATSAIYVMVVFQTIIYMHEFLPRQFNDNMGSGGSLIDQLLFFADNLLHVVLLDMFSIFQWRVSDIAPVTTLGRWLVFLTRLVMTISFAASISTLIKTAHLRLDDPIPS